MPRQIMLFDRKETRELIAEALSERRGSPCDPSDIRFRLADETSGHGEAEATRTVFKGAEASFRYVRPEGPSKAGTQKVVFKVCTECSTRRLDEQGDCPSCDR